MQNVVCMCGYNPKFFQGTTDFSFNMGMCFLQYFCFLSKCNTIFKVPYIRLETAYTLLGLGLEIAAVRLSILFWVCFFFWVYLCQCHESSCHLLMSPLCLYCVELLVNVYCDVLNLNSWFKTL